MCKPYVKMFLAVVTNSGLVVAAVAIHFHYRYEAHRNG